MNDTDTLVILLSLLCVHANQIALWYFTRSRPLAIHVISWLFLTETGQWMCKQQCQQISIIYVSFYDITRSALDCNCVQMRRWRMKITTTTQSARLLSLIWRLHEQWTDNYLLQNFILNINININMLYISNLHHKQERYKWYHNIVWSLTHTHTHL